MTMDEAFRFLSDPLEGAHLMHAPGLIDLVVFLMIGAAVFCLWRIMRAVERIAGALERKP